ncbi:MAG TPA: TetR/AcrR family transcriptional regulator [Jatrophihabitans sp.]|nr:TetR/AcrR family transcriptional regulator [Jatrophihabitans sp.]
MKKPVARVTGTLEAIAQAARIDGRAARWTEHRAQRREELIDAAIAAINLHGSDAGVDQIAAVARTSKPVIYRYFADKNELYRAVADRVIARVVAALQRVPQDSEPKTLLRASIDAYLQLLADNPRLFGFVTQHRLPGEAEFTRPVADVLTAALGEQLRAIGLDPSGARPWGAAVVGFIRAASLWWLDNPDAMTRAQLTEYLAALLWGGGAGVFQLAGRDVDARPTPGVFVRL